MIRWIAVETTTKEELTVREQKIIDLFIMNTAASVNALLTGKPVALEPVADSTATFSLKVTFQEAVETKTGEQLMTLLEQRIQTMFRMAEMADPAITLSSRRNT